MTVPIPVSEFSAILSGLSGLIVSSGLTYWVYKTLNATIKNLKDEVSALKEELTQIKHERSRWYHKAVVLSSMLQKTRNCPHGKTCSVRAEFEKYIEEEGVI